MTSIFRVHVTSYIYFIFVLFSFLFSRFGASKNCIAFSLRWYPFATNYHANFRFRTSLPYCRKPAPADNFFVISSEKNLKIVIPAVIHPFLPCAIRLSIFDVKV